MKATHYRHLGDREVLFEGSPSAGELSRIMTAAVEADGFDGGRGVVLDVRKVGDAYAEVDLEAVVDEIGARADAFGDRIAIVIAVGDPRDEELARLFIDRAAHWVLTIGVFFEEAAAHEWLGWTGIGDAEEEAEDDPEELRPAPVFEIPNQAQRRVVVVEDNDAERRPLELFLSRERYEVESFADPLEAIQATEARPAEVVITDEDMPGMRGTELGAELQRTHPDTRLILVTGRGDEETAQEALRAGFMDYHVKPVNLTDVARSVRRGILARAREQHERETEVWLRSELQRRARAMREISVAGMSTLINALEARSPHFLGHSQAVARCASGIARTAGLSLTEVKRIGVAGLLHDIGMIGVPDAVVNKPGPLTAEERAAIGLHPQLGYDILLPLTHLGDAIEFVLEHHERFDGSGYPHQKSGDEISLGGRIVGLAESWTALTEARSFRDRQTPAEALETISAASGVWFDPDLVAALRTWLRT